MIDLHNAGHHQAVNLRAQAADVCREFQREHGHSAIGKVDAGTTQTRFLIEGGGRRHVVGHVSNVHLKFKITVFQPINSNCIIEIARGFTVDSYNRKLSEVAPLVQLTG